MEGFYSFNWMVIVLTVPNNQDLIILLDSKLYVLFMVWKTAREKNSVFKNSPVHIIFKKVVEFK